MSKPERGTLGILKRTLPTLSTPPAVAELERHILSIPAKQSDVQHQDVGNPSTVQQIDLQQPGDIQQIADVRLEDVQHNSTSQPSDIHHKESGMLTGVAVGIRRKRRVPDQMFTQRIEATLFQELKEKAEYNSLYIKDIVEEALREYLPRLPSPRHGAGK